MDSLLRTEEHSVNRSRSSIEEDEDLFSESSSNASQVFKNLKNNITVEPMMFIHMVAMTCASVILQNLYIDRICRIREGFNETVCENLTTTDYIDIESIVDKSAARYTIYRGAIETGFPIILSLFLGPYTDKHSTKPTMLLPILGYILSGVMYILFSFLPNVHPHYFLLCSVPIALSGGMVALVLSVFSFIAKCTDEEDRSFRIAMLEICWFFGIPLGLLIGETIFKRFGYPGVFITSTSLYIMSALYCLFFVKEYKSDAIVANEKGIFLELFNVDAVKDIFSTIFRPRNGNARSFILLLIVAMCLKIFTVFGAVGVLFLFVRKRLGWDYQVFTTFAIIDSVIQNLGSWIMIFFTMKLFKLSDTTIGLFSSLGYSVAAIVLAFTNAGWMMYLGAFIQMFCGLNTVVIRSMLSKCIGKEELAKVYTFVACGEAAMPLLATALYSSVFQLTIDIFPGAMFFITAGLNLLIFFTFIYFHYSRRSLLPHVPLNDDST